MESPKPRLSILIVEDEAITLESLVVIVAKKYPEAVVYKALNGRAGLELFHNHTPEIVITDINMPKLSGSQMAAQIRETRAETKLIAITGDLAQLSAGIAAGDGCQFDHYIGKPLDFMDLFEAIDKCLV